ncbi:MAG TPA: hypothetical protein VFZ18_10060, partial [Longimicrobiaceae bacterium]
MSTSNEPTPGDSPFRQGPGPMIAGTPQSGSRGESISPDLESDARQMAAQAKDEARRVADQVGQEVRERGEQIRDTVEAKADEGRSRAAETGDALAAAFRAAGDSLRDRHEDRLGHLTDELAEQVERFSGYLRDNDMRGLMGDLEDVARRNPTGFLGSTLTAGLMAGRFLRASGGDSRDDARRTDGLDSTYDRPPSQDGFGATPAAETTASRGFTSPASPARDRAATGAPTPESA